MSPKNIIFFYYRHKYRIPFPFPQPYTHQEGPANPAEPIQNFPAKSLRVIRKPHVSYLKCQPDNKDQKQQGN